tara:strand:- start:9024 stop:10448 length:1425 start_codon:yes stop_codon:yes gene_type:complete
MGSKRIGLARVERLLENLKREINFGAGTKLTLSGAGAGIGRSMCPTDRYLLNEDFNKLPKLNAYLEGSETKDFGSLAAAAEVTEDVTVTGAALGDFAVASLALDTQATVGLIITAEVTAANTVSVTLANAHASSAIDLASTTLTAKVFESGMSVSNESFEVLGTNMTDALSTRSATRASVTLTTAGADEDQAILAPHLDTNQTAWTGVKWGTENQVEWECSITTNAIDNQKVWAGLKLTNDQLGAVDANQIFFKAATDLTNGEALSTSDNAAMAAAGGNMLWHVIYSIAGVDYTTNTELAMAANTTYHLKITIDSDRKASAFINGTQYGLVNDSGHGGASNVGTTATWGQTDTIANGGVTASASSGNQTLTVDGVSALTTFKAGDTVFKSDRTLFGIVQSVDSATQITLETCLADVADDDELHNFGQKATSATQKSKALTNDIDLIPYIGIEGGDANPAILDVHYMACSRVMVE